MTACSPRIDRSGPAGPPPRWSEQQGGNSNERSSHNRAEIHRKDDGQGLLDGAKGLHDGSFLEMVKLMMSMAPEERRGHVIQKLGDRMYDAGEVEAIAARGDYPG